MGKPQSAFKHKIKEVAKEPKKTVKEEVKYLKKGGAPKKLIEHEKREAKGKRK